MERVKHWEEIMKDNMSYEDILKNYMGCYFTRPEWDGFHFIDGDNQHVIITKDLEVLIVTEEEVWNKDSEDWMLVSITDEAVRIVQNHQYDLIEKERKRRESNER